MLLRQFFRPGKPHFPTKSLVLSLIITLIFSAGAFAGRFYVDVSSTAISPDGLSWASAFPNFETAVGAAASGDEIWVAKGTYQPVSGASYTLKTGVRIYGGFTNLDTQISQRNWETNLTVLKGNNSRVIYNENVSGTAALDGFTISDGVNGSFYGGAGMCNVQSSPTLTNIIFRDNHSTPAGLTYGGGLFNTTSSSPILTNVKFIDNVCTSSQGQANGAGMYNQDNCFPVLNNVTFSGNRCESGNTSTAYALGAGIYNNKSSPVYNNVVFTKNVCAAYNTFGGAIYNNKCTTPSLLTNVVFNKNEAYFGAAVYSTLSNMILVHATAFGNINSATANSFGFVASSSTIKISNSVFFNNFWDLAFYTPVSTTINNSFIDLAGNETSTSNNITSNLSPFLNGAIPEGPDGIWMTADDGLRLAYDAAVVPVDLGETVTTQSYPAAIVSTASFDIKGTARPVGPAYDMGAYEGGVDKEVIYVDAANTSSTHDGLSWATAFDKLEDALDPTISDSGRPIWVAKGTYQPAGGESYSMNTLNRIYGGFKNTDTDLNQRDWIANKTILKGNGSHVINNDFNITGIRVSNAAQLDGFTITGGNAGTKGGGGMYNFSSSPFVANVIFDDNEAEGHGGGMHNYSSLPVLYNVTFSNNRTDGDGGGMYNLGSEAKLDKVIFINNNAGARGGGMTNDNHGAKDIKNVVFENNSAANGGAVANLFTEPNFTNAVFSGNTSTSRGSVLYNDENVRFINTTFFNNISTIGGIFFNVDQVTPATISIINSIFRRGSSINDFTPTITYSLTESAVSGTQNEVYSGSLFLNESLPSGADGIWLTADDGLQLSYELNSAVVTAINSGKTIVNADGNASVTDAATKDITSFTRSMGYDKGAYEYRYPSPVTRFYVDASHPAGLRDGRSWATAYNKLETALADAGLAEGAEIWVAKGTYQPATGTSFVMKKGVAIYGGMLNTYTDLSEQAPLANPTILKGNGTSVINNTFTAGNEMTDSAVLDGFTVQDGVSGAGGAGINNTYASPLLRNLIVKNNSASGDGDGGGIALNYSESQLMNVRVENNYAGYFGGGICIKYSSPTLINVILKQNTGVFGGGIASIQESSYQLINVVFDRNKADIDYGAGGGIYSDSGPTPPIFNNVIFSGNEAPEGAGLYTYQSPVQLTNTTFYKNIATGSGGAANFTSQAGHLPSIANSIFWGNKGVTGAKDIFLAAQSVNIINSFTQSDFSGKSVTNIQGTTSPFFNESAPMGPDGIWLTEDDGLQLNTCSPALNSGNNDAATSIGVDIVENSRIKNAIIDMGAYESQNAPASGSYETHAALSENNANDLSLVPTCDDSGWTYYADPTHPDNFVFAINWGTGNDAAKAAATVNIKLSETNKEAFTTDKGIVAMRRYWNVDLDGSALAHSVQVRYYYDAADVADMETAVGDASMVAKDDEVKWFKTTDNLYDPSQITATQINGGHFEMLTPLYGTDNDVAYAQFDDVGSFSGGTAVILAEKKPSLPVTLVSFNARQTESKVNLLTWSTAAEKDFSHFEIQHSGNANVFTGIGKVPGGQGSIYQFVHNEPVAGINYYRLKMVDNDGSFAYSRIIAVANETKGQHAGNFYPNPVIGKNTSIDIHVAEAETWQTRTYSVSGLLLKSGTIHLQTGINKIMFDIKGLPTGIHLVKFSNEQGQEFVRKIAIE